MPGVKANAPLRKQWSARIDGYAVSLAWSPRLDYLAAASADGPIHLFDARTGGVSAVLPGHGFGTSSIAWSRTGSLLASTGQDGHVKVWEPGVLDAKFTLAAGASWGEKVAWCPTSDVLASAAGKKLRLWASDGTLLQDCPDAPSTLADLAWQPKQATLASAGYGRLNLWNVGQSTPMRSFEWKGSMLAIAWSPNGKYLAAGAQDASVRFWLVASGKDLEMSGYPSKVRELSWHWSSRYLATGGAPVVCVWDCAGKGPAGTAPIQLEAHTQTVSALAYQHARNLLASGAQDGKLIVWQPDKLDTPLGVADVGSAVSQVAWSADDRCVAAGTAEGNIVVYSCE